MKKLILLVSLVSLANAGGLWSLVKNDGLPITKSTESVLEVSGVNVRVYAFEPLGTENKQCVMVVSSEFHQLQCFNKKDK